MTLSWCNLPERMEWPGDVPHNRVTHGAYEIEAITNTVQSGIWANGPRVAELEKVLIHAASRQNLPLGVA